MVRARRDELIKAMMADWLDDQDAPASCEVQVEVRFEMPVKFLDLDESEWAFLPKWSVISMDFHGDNTKGQ